MILLNFVYAALAVVLGLVGFAGLYYAFTDRLPFPELREPNPEPSAVASPTDAKLVLFYVDWCQHCRHAKPIFDEMKRKYDGHVVAGTGVTLHFEAVNAEADRRRARLHHIDAYPTVKLLTKDAVWTYEGPMREAALVAFVQSVLA